MCYFMTNFVSPFPSISFYFDQLKEQHEKGLKLLVACHGANSSSFNHDSSKFQLFRSFQIYSPLRKVLFIEKCCSLHYQTHRKSCSRSCSLSQGLLCLDFDSVHVTVALIQGIGIAVVSAVDRSYANVCLMHSELCKEFQFFSTNSSRRRHSQL